MNNIQKQNYLDETIKILKKHNPEEIILFGGSSSYFVGDLLFLCSTTL